MHVTYARGLPLVTKPPHGCHSHIQTLPCFAMNGPASCMCTVIGVFACHSRDLRSTSGLLILGVCLTMFALIYPRPLSTSSMKCTRSLPTSNMHNDALMQCSMMRCISCFLLITECCLVQTGLERVVRMALTVGLYVWVFQSQASLDKKVNKDYLNIRRSVDPMQYLTRTQLQLKTCAKMPCPVCCTA